MKRDRQPSSAGALEEAMAGARPDERAEDALATWAESRLSRDGDPPPAAPRRRLLEAVAGVERFRPFFSRLASIVGLDESGLLSTLALVDEPTGWTVVPGVAFRDFSPGPGSLATEAGLIRVDAGTAFPRHLHVGRETGMVLEGSLVLDGRTYLPGDVVESEAGSAHEFTAGPARDLVLVVAHSGIRFG